MDVAVVVVVGGRGVGSIRQDAGESWVGVAVVVEVGVGQGGVVDPLGELVLVGGVQQAQVVDAGLRWGAGVGLFGAGLGVGVAADPVGDRGAEAALLVADLDVGEVEGVKDQFDPAACKQRVDLVGVGVQRHGRVGGDGAVLGP